ncbi:MAG: Helix-turn-helix domain [Pseudonocardiales bacterium]|jgi:excisionase family DNA binding protein|nr:Helix-turn-helix domain [Pseudonocardiales bacterium]
MSAPISHKIPRAAELTNLSPDYIKRAIHDGQLLAKKVGRDYLVTHEALIRWIESLPDAD